MILEPTLDTNLTKEEMYVDLLARTKMPEEYMNEEDALLYRVGCLMSLFSYLQNSDDIRIYTRRKGDSPFIGIAESSFTQETLAKRKYYWLKRGDRFDLMWMFNGREACKTALHDPVFKNIRNVLLSLDSNLKDFIDVLITLSSADIRVNISSALMQPQIMGALIDTGKGTFSTGKDLFFQIDSKNRDFIVQFCQFFKTTNQYFMTIEPHGSNINPTYRLRLSEGDACNLAKYINPYVINNRENIDNFFIEASKTKFPPQRGEKGYYISQGYREFEG